MIFGCLQQVAMDERQDLQAVTGNDKRNMSEDTGDFYGWNSSPDPPTIAL